MANNQSIEKKENDAIANRDEERTRDRRVFVPRTDIYEDGEAIFVNAEVPGAAEQNVDIMLEKNVLTINAYPGPEESGDYRLIYSEYGLGDFQRRFVLSDEIDREKIDATVKDGVLRLRLPKSTEARSRKITVKSG